MRNPWHPSYPPEDTAILDHFGGRFEAAYVALHPFVELPVAIAEDLTGYPSDETVARHGVPVTWQRVCADGPFASIAELNRALLTSIGALRPEYATPAQSDRLEGVLADRPLWAPGEGQIEPLLLPPIARLLRSAGFGELIARDEFGDHIQRVAIPEPVAEQRLALANTEFVVSSVSAPDDSLLAIVHWDSFFTLILGTDDVVSEVERGAAFEGFRCSAATTHLWWLPTPPG